MVPFRQIPPQAPLAGQRPAEGHRQKENCLKTDCRETKSKLDRTRKASMHDQAMEVNLLTGHYSGSMIRGKTAANNANTSIAAWFSRQPTTSPG